MSEPDGPLPYSANPWTLQLMLWRRFTWRHWIQAPRSTILLVAILALGVGMVLAIRLANRAAVAGFEVFTDTVTGESDFVLEPPSGRLPEEALAEIREALGAEPVQLFPVLEITAGEVHERGDSPAAQPDSDPDDESLADRKLESFTLLGVDLVALQNLAYSKDLAEKGGWLTRSEEVGADLGDRDGVWNYLRDGNAVFVTRTLADQRSLAVGDTLTVGIHDRRVDFDIAGILPAGDGSMEAPAQLLIMDLPALQRLAGLEGFVQRVEVRLMDGENLDPVRRRVAEILERVANDRWNVETPKSRRQTGESMTAAFRMNLTALSLLALVVGVYLILQALEGAVVRRRSEIAILRSLGVEEAAIRRAWLLEAFSLGLVGSVVGVVLGVAGAQLAVKAVARTVDMLYYANTVNAAAWNWTEVLIAVGAGVVAALVAGWLPAHEAAATPPAQLLSHGGRQSGPALVRDVRWGLALTLLGCVLYAMPPLRLSEHVRFPLAGHLAAFTWIIGGTSLAGALFRPLAELGVWLGGGFPTLRYASSQLRRATGRHYLTLAGLVLSIGMATGMAILIHSFEFTVKTWIQGILKADLYVASQYATGPGSSSRLGPDTWEAILADPDVRDADLFQVYPIRLLGANTALAGSRFVSGDEGRDIVWIQQPAFGPKVPAAGLGAGHALASEAFSERYGLKQGDTVELPTPAGPKSVVLDGIFADYGMERGTVMVDLDRLWEWYGDRQVVSMSVYLQPGADADTVRRRLGAAHPEIMSRTNERLRVDIIQVFRQTFSITYVLQGMAVVVAVVGLGLSLASLLLERRAELRTLKELGMSRAGIALCAAIEGVAVAAVGLVGGLVQSFALAWLLIHVINKQSFGWTLGWAVPWPSLALMTVVVLGVGGLVSWTVGLHAARLPSEQEG